MHTDKQVYQILASGAEAFRLLTGGIELAGDYRCRSLTIKALERRIDGLFEPADPDEPVYVVEFQAGRDPAIYHRIVAEVALYGAAQPEREVRGVLIFTQRTVDPATPAWREVADKCAVLRVVYLEDVLAEGFRREPGNPYLNAFLPWWLEDQAQLKRQAPAAYAAIAGAPIDRVVRERLMEVFVSWMLERFRQHSYEEVLKMLDLFTPLEETVAYKQLVGIGWKKGRADEARTILMRQMTRRFGPLPKAVEARLTEAAVEQLEEWADRVLDAQHLDDIFGPTD